MMRCLRAISALFVVTALLSACSSTALTGSWKEPGFQGHVRKVFILGVADKEVNRRIFEDVFARELSEGGVECIPSYRDLPSEDVDNKEAVVSRLLRAESDAILITRITDMRLVRATDTGYTADFTSEKFFNPSPYERNWDSFFARHHGMAYLAEPTTDEFPVATIEAILYEAKSGNLIWSAQLETVIDNDLKTIFNDFVEIVTDDMREQGLI